MIFDQSCGVTWPLTRPLPAALCLAMILASPLPASSSPPPNDSLLKPTQPAPAVNGADGQAGMPAHLFEGPPITAERAAIVAQGEDLVRANLSHARKGHVAVQEMSGFGQGWGGNAQLFFAAQGKCARLVLDTYTAGPAVHTVDIYLTQAPDYGKLSLRLEGGGKPVAFDGYAPAVRPSGPLRLGTAVPDRGRLTIDLRVTGRHRKSTGYFAGVDRIVLTPAGPPK